MRSGESWGIGDLGDLADLATWAAAAHDADFVLINPLHAAEPVAPVEPSPYLPTTRRFVNPIYLRVEDVPELARLDHAAYRRVLTLGAAARALNAEDRIDRDAAWTAKKEALRLVFGVALTGRRARSFVDFCDREGYGLTTYATWCALVEEHGLQWTQWPLELQDPSSAAVATFRERHADDVDFHGWLQLLCEQQLAAAQRRPGGGASAWSTTSPWGCARRRRRLDPADPWRPASPSERRRTSSTSTGRTGASHRAGRRLPAGYPPLDAAQVLRVSGGLRVDHVIGLFRLWWIPAGGRRPRAATCATTTRPARRAGARGARAGAFVIGEDLGTSPRTFGALVFERGLVGTSILWFEVPNETALGPCGPERAGPRPRGPPR